MSKLYFCDHHSYGGNLPCPGCFGFQPGKVETYSSTMAECKRLQIRVSELEAEAEHPEWMKRIQRERREAVAIAVGSINVQLQEHGIDMQFDPSAFIQQ